MPRDRSLDEFLPGDGATAPDDADVGAEEGAGGESESGAGDAEDPPADDGANREGVTPIASTYDWAPGGARCGACGATVEARWRDGDALVCADCKEW